MLIPQEARFAMAALREGVSLETYLDDVWCRRDAVQGPQPKASAQWPFVRRPAAMLRAYVERLPTRLRQHA